MIAAAKLETTAPDPLATVLEWRRMVSAGFSLTVEGDGLVVAPASRLSDPQRAHLRAHKTALVELLRDAEVLHRALLAAGPAGLGWREGTSADWADGRLLAVGEVLYRDGRYTTLNKDKLLSEARDGAQTMRRRLDSTQA